MNALAKSTVVLATALLLWAGGVVFVGCRRAPEAGPQGSAVPYVLASDPVEAGRYLAIVGACNDCHTPGYDIGPVPEADWLVGSPVGFRGPWGTTYPANLRLTVQALSEDEWVEMLHTRKDAPPMPWMNVNRLHEQDARALYQFIKSLGPKGEPVPMAVAADQEPTTPYISFEPLHLERLAPPAVQATH